MDVVILDKMRCPGESWLRGAAKAVLLTRRAKPRTIPALIWQPLTYTLLTYSRDDCSTASLRIVPRPSGNDGWAGEGPAAADRPD